MTWQALRHRIALFTLLLLTAGVCAGCMDGTVYHHYEPIPVAGWEKTDTIMFGVPPIDEDGLYNIRLGLRTTGQYPFMSITLIAEMQTIAVADTMNEKPVADSLSQKPLADSLRIKPLADSPSIKPLADSLNIEPVASTLSRERPIIRYNLPCRLMNKSGHTQGQGINYYQYEFIVADIPLNAGDSLRIGIRHDMKREILPGLSDLGIIIRKK